MKRNIYLRTIPIEEALSRVKAVLDREALLGVERVGDAGADLVDLAPRFHLDEQAAVAVHVQQRVGLLVVDLHPVADGLFVVVRTALDLGALQHAVDDRIIVGGQ